MKTTRLKFIAITLLMLINSAANAQDYCESGSYGNFLIWIESIYSGPFANESGQIMFPQDDQDHLYQAYWDYTDLQIDWQVGDNPVELKPGLRYNQIPAQWNLWIDLNADLSFGHDELLLSRQSFGTLYENIDLSELNLTEPLITRMRISASYDSYVPACGSVGHGEVEDYQVVITPQIKTSYLVPEEYATIQAAIDAATPGSQVLVNDGVYPESLIVETPDLTIESVNGQEFTNISGAFNQHTIWVKSPGVSIIGFDLTGSRNAYKDGILFDAGADDGRALNIHCGTNPEGLTYDQNIHIKNANRITVSGLTCQDRGHIGILATNTSGSQFNNNTITGSIRSGIHLAQSYDVIIDNNVMNENQRGVYIQNSDRIFALDNQCSHNESGMSGNGFYIIDSFEITLANNECTGNRQMGMWIQRSADVSLVNNTLTQNDSHGLKAEYTDYLLLEDNSIEHNYQQGVSIDFSDEVTVKNNQFNFNANTGLRIYATHNSLIEDNHFKDNTYQFKFQAANDNVFTGNRLESNKLYRNCHFVLSNATGNQIYLNSFIFPNSGYICSEVYSGNIWRSPYSLPYEYQGRGILDISVLGNYYSYGDHTDSNDDGVVELPQSLPGAEPADEFALRSEASDYYIF